MKISTFFEKTLGANLSNARWSWGAFRPTTNQLFLRLWDDGIETVDGVERVSILWHDWDGRSAGFTERKRHVELLRDGAEGYGVVCTAADINPGGNRAIAKFDDKMLLKLGDVFDVDARVYAPIVGRVPVTQLRRRQTGFSTLVPDLRSIINKKSGATMKETLANARVGQGAFRSAVLAQWGGKCAVTGSSTLDALRASHIKPWRDSTDSERLDPHNGIPLVATLDALFDAGLISFTDDGQVVISESVSKIERQLLKLTGAVLVRRPTDQAICYLHHHRTNVFLNTNRTEIG